MSEAVTLDDARENILEQTKLRDEGEILYEILLEGKSKITSFETVTYDDSLRASIAEESPYLTFSRVRIDGQTTEYLGLTEEGKELLSDYRGVLE